MNADLIAELVDYKPGPPPWASILDISLDAGICTEIRCKCCGNEQMTFRPYHRPSTKSYIALAYCGRCGFCEEI